jgi:hypothetical protein
MKYIQAIADGQSYGYLYIGQYVTGNIITWFNKITGWSIPIMFTWFNVLTLISVGLSSYVLASLFNGWRYGLLAIPVSMFISPTVLNLYDTGAIFDLGTVGCLVPLLFVATIKFLRSKVKGKIIWGVIASLCLMLCFIWHTMVILSVQNNYTAELAQASTGYGSFEIAFDISEYFLFIIGVWSILLIAVILVIIFLKRIKKLSKESKVVISGYGCLVLLLSVITFSDITGYSIRVGIDLAITISIIGAVLIPFFLKRYKLHISLISVIIVSIIISSMINLSTYMKYNSALTPVDKEVIEYINDLPGEYYSCSPEVAYWIYDNYLNKEYKEDELPYIKRNIPMTSKTTPNTRYYWWQGKSLPEYDLNNAKEFEKDGLQIYVVTDG